MDIHVWFAFVLAALAIGVIPGPGVLSIIGYAISSGRQTALASVAGIAIGNMCAMTLSLAGVGALLAASALAFTILKWAGALYLIALGLIAIWRSREEPLEAAGSAPPISSKIAFWGNMTIGIFHPKTIVFFVAFVPQFIDPAGSYWRQAAILIVTFTLVVAVSDTLYALGASRARDWLSTPKVRLWTKRAGGGALIGAGAATALSRS